MRKPTMLVCFILLLLSFDSVGQTKTEQRAKHKSSPDSVLVTILKGLSSIEAGHDELNLQLKKSTDTLRSALAITETQLLEKFEEKHTADSFITIGLALLAALIALGQVKMNIISSARIAWIESLRVSVSNFIGEVELLNDMIVEMYRRIDRGEKKETVIKELFEPITDAIKKANVLGTQIKLYLNSREAKHKALESAIEEFADKSAASKRDELRQDIGKLRDECISLSKDIFKREWERAKGNPVKRLWQYFFQEG